MRRFLSTLAVILSALFLVASAKAEKTVIVVVTQGMTDAHQKSALAASKSLAIGCEDGDELCFVDGTTFRRIAAAKIVKSASSRARLASVRTELNALQTHLSSAPTPTERGREVTANIPGLLTSLRTEGKFTRILIFASLYFNADPAATYSRGQYLSPGFFLASSRESVFGTADIKGLLKGVSIDWICTDDVIDTLERRAITHYLCCWASELGAVLTSVENSAPVAVENALKGLSTPVTNPVIDRTDTAMEVRQVRANAAALPVTAPTAPAAERLSETAATVPAPQAGFASIYSVWTSADGGADIDVWVKPTPSSAELSFATKETPEGKYIRDIQRSRQSRDAANWMAAWEGVQIPASSLATAVVWLNVYKNPSGADVEGFVRVQCDERSIDIPFRFAGIKGDEASGHRRRENNSCWIKVDIAPYFASNTVTPR